MAKLARKTAKVFGSTSDVNQVSQFGSLNAGSPVYSLDPAVIQSLSNWLSGWFDAVEDVNSPAIEDMNAFCYVMAYQIAYGMQEGVAEWDSGTTYFSGGIVNASGVLYVSIADNNLNHVVSDVVYWKQFLNISDLSGILPVSKGGTNSTAALNNNRVMKSSGGAIVEAAAITASKALASDANGIPVASATTAVELAFVAGVTSSIQTQINAISAVAPTVQKFLSGSGTYTLPTSPRTPLYIEVIMVGGGGGGGGTGSGFGTGSTGGNTTFGTTLLAANGGALGGSGSSGGAGGTASLGSGPVGIAVSGGIGAARFATSGTGYSGGQGGASFFGGAGQGVENSSGSSAATNSGSGGAGGGLSTLGANCGGGAGGYVDAIITSPASTYSYAVGAAGAGGAAGSGGTAGGSGAAGMILVKEFYQ